MVGHPEITWSRVSGIELAEIRTLMLIKEAHSQQLQRILDAKEVGTREQLDWLAVRNFLHTCARFERGLPIKAAILYLRFLFRVPHDPHECLLGLSCRNDVIL
jgi:hypothetical protein